MGSPKGDAATGKLRRGVARVAMVSALLAIMLCV
jgi:hypothetical protein